MAYATPGSNVYLRATKESVFGTYDSGGDSIVVRLPSDSAFNAKTEPISNHIRSADSRNLLLQNISTKFKTEGPLATPIYPTNQQFWAEALFGPLGAGDPASYTFDYFDSVDQIRYLGGKFTQGTWMSNEQQQWTGLSGQLTFQKSEALTGFSRPAISTYPGEIPYTHTDSAGNVKLGADLITSYSSFAISVQNVLDSNHDEFPYIQHLTYCGRNVSITFPLKYTAEKTWRAKFEAQTALAITAKWAKSTYNVAFDFQAANYTTAWGRGTPLGGVSTQNVTVSTFLDPSSDKDMAIAFTVPA